jgi:uncharacterized protein (DUF1330 family)
MLINELTSTAMDLAAPSIGDGPVTMVNLLWFRGDAAYAATVEDAKAKARSAYYEDYAGAFRTVANELGIVGVEVVFIGSRKDGLVASSDDDWDDIVIIRYGSFADFRRIVESEQYLRLASPHRVASIANWRLVATGPR